MKAFWARNKNPIRIKKYVIQHNRGHYDATEMKPKENEIQILKSFGYIHTMEIWLLHESKFHSAFLICIYRIDIFITYMSSLLTTDYNIYTAKCRRLVNLYWSLNWITIGIWNDFFLFNGPTL